ncbi:hypothetical protein [Paenibacillus sp. FSL E2-0177]|uniref:hypothetical protein n=1 Tax=Paenibacillus sp. FSL E2-0177 TaxID=2921360 RepID=UPI0030ED7E4E
MKREKHEVPEEPVKREKPVKREEHEKPEEHYAHTVPIGASGVCSHLTSGVFGVKR